MSNFLLSGKFKQLFNHNFCLFAFFYFFVSWQGGIQGIQLWVNAAILFSSFFCVGLFGYFTNDMADMEADRLAGKYNMAARFSGITRVVLAAVAVSAGIFLLAWYCPPCLWWILAEALLLLLYAFPPFRLKERGFLGVLADSFYAYVIPVFILLAFVGYFGEVDPACYIFLPALYFFLGIKNILRHQLDDLPNDIRSGTRTFAMKHGKPAEKGITFGIVLAWVTWCAFGVYQIGLAQAGWLAFLFVVPAAVALFKIVASLYFRAPDLMTGTPDFEIIYYGFWVFWIAMLCLGRYEYLPGLVFLFSPVMFTKFRYGAVKPAVRFCVWLYWAVLPVASAVVNYSLYYLFLLFGKNLKQKNTPPPVLTEPAGADAFPLPALLSVPVEKNIHGLWIGNMLSKMELLTIRSFLGHGYVFHLWLYDPLETELPDGCVVCDASLIVPREKIFRYRNSSQFGVGKGSVSGFSDIFRYKLLHDVGGWWVDMDVTCLKPFDVSAEYFFRAHHDLPLVGNVMKAPKKSPLMWKCYTEALESVTENNRDWHKPITILADNVHAFGLEKFIVGGISNTDEWPKVKLYVTEDRELPTEWCFIHWCNEVWRTGGISKNRVLRLSAYARVLEKYGLLESLSPQERQRHDHALKMEFKAKKMMEFI